MFIRRQQETNRIVAQLEQLTHVVGTMQMNYLNQIFLQMIVNLKIWIEEVKQRVGSQKLSQIEGAKCRRVNNRTLKMTDRNWYKGIKVDVSESEGRLQPDEFLYRVNKVDQLFERTQMPDEKKVKFVSLKLKGHALV